MDSFVENLMNHVLAGNNLSVITQLIGGDEKVVQSALIMGAPLLLGSMANSKSTPNGTDILARAFPAPC
jgi:hypothetical protein